MCERRTIDTKKTEALSSLHAESKTRNSKLVLDGGSANKY